MPSGLLRPPGARAEAEFRARCIHCGKCAEACPYGSIRMAAGRMAGFLGQVRNTPYIHAKSIPCWLCMKCPPVCPSGALRPVRDMARADMGMAVLLKNRCHNWVGTVLCRTCYDKCPLRGTAMVLEGGDIPAVADACVGCGVCEHVCPVDAIVVRPDAGRRTASNMDEVAERRTASNMDEDAERRTASDVDEDAGRRTASNMDDVAGRRTATGKADVADATPGRGGNPA